MSRSEEWSMYLPDLDIRAPNVGSGPYAMSYLTSARQLVEGGSMFTPRSVTLREAKPHVGCTPRNVVSHVHHSASKARIITMMLARVSFVDSVRLFQAALGEMGQFLALDSSRRGAPSSPL